MTGFDVIIVGFGPTGATLASLLGQAGIRVAVFDKLPDLYPLPRAIGLDHEAMRILQQVGIADRLAEHIAPYRPSEYRGMDGELIMRLDMQPRPYLQSWAPNYVFDQPALERVLRQRVAALSTVSVFLEAEVVSTGQDDNCVWADVACAETTAPTRFRAQFLVACDGGGSPVRKRLGIELEDLDFDEPWLVVDAIVSDETLSRLPQTQVQYCEAARPSTYVIGPGNHRRWEIMLLDGDSLSPDFPDSELWPLLKRWIAPGEARLWRAAAYRFHGLIATDWRRDRILLAGDSAHMTPPFMAQGMVGGLRDAVNIAWKLTAILQRGSDPSLLDTVMQERRPHMKQTILTAMGLGQIICERDPERALERDQRLRAAYDGTIETEYRQNMIPTLTAGLLALGSPLTGALAPQPTVRAKGFEGRLDDLTGGCIRVFVLGLVGPEDKTAYLSLLEPFAGVLVQFGREGPLNVHLLEVMECPPVLKPWLYESGQRIVIVRPDHYVYATARTHDEGLLYLNELCSKIIGKCEAP